MSQAAPFLAMTPAEALKIVVVNMPPGIARKVVRDALLGFSELDALEWRRMMETEKKRRQRQEAKQGIVPIAPSTPSGQRDVVPFVLPVPSGQASPSSPAPSPGPPSPPTPPPFIPPNPPPVVPENDSLAASAPNDEPDAPPAAAGGHDGKKLSDAAKAARTARQAEKKALSLRIGAIMHRGPKTLWSPKEWKKLGEISPADHPIPEQDFRAIEAYYAQHWPPLRENNNLRHDVSTLINNWSAEVDRAKAWLDRLPAGKRARLLNAPTSPAAAAIPDGDPLLSVEFLEWLPKWYPAKVGITRLSEVHVEVRREFRAAQPKASITAPSA